MAGIGVFNSTYASQLRSRSTIERGFGTKDFSGITIYSPGITLPIAIGLALWARWRISNKSKEQSKFQELLNDYLAADRIDELQAVSLTYWEALFWS